MSTSVYPQSADSLDTFAGSRTTYSCWPGYLHVSGDLQRDCLSSLIWGGQRPTCAPVCDATYPQSCKYCKAVVSDRPHCSIVNRTHITSDACRKQHTLSPSYSVYYDGSVCLTSNCQFDINGTSAQDVFSLTSSCSHRKSIDKVIQNEQQLFFTIMTLLYVQQIFVTRYFLQKILNVCYV